MSAIVGQTFEALTAKTSPLLEYFTGVAGGRPDYTDPENSKDLQKLAEGLVSFFSDALGCSDGSIPPYNEVNAAGTTLKEFHVGMPISIFEFNAFNDILLGVLKKNGVVDADLKKVRGDGSHTHIHIYIYQYLYLSISTLNHSVVSVDSHRVGKPWRESWCVQFRHRVRRGR